MAKPSTVRRPTEAAAIGTTHPSPGACVPKAVLLDRIAFTHRQQDRHGFRSLVHLLARAAGEVGEQ